MLLSIWNFLRAPEITHGKELLASELAGRLFASTLLITCPLLFFLPPLLAATAGLATSFVLMTAAEAIGPRRRIYPLRKFSVFAARILILPIVCFSLVIMLGSFTSPDMRTPTFLALHAAIALLSLNALYHAIRIPAER